MTTNDLTKVYDTILSIPSMNEIVKIDLKISSKNVHLLNSVIERGLSVKDEDKTASLINGVSKENLQELRSIANDRLKKQDLSN